MLLDVEEIKDYLPQRYPFLLVDRIVEMDIGKSIVGYKNITINEPFFVGHFPGQPIMPGVLIIEALAQVAGVLGFKSQEKKPKDGYLYYFVGADEVRLRRPVVPGDKLVLKANIITNRRGVYRFSAEASVDDELVGSMNILCAERKIDVE
ncbi:MAG: 3-hydroxyacyl-[acyl-carrier-protein] dehydratase FabZ [Gammaproteobacteria bacterium]|nr:3-hydroxyacyl-[acyl-carrier-protein] dehydratase FabZ [Gammaproteobacteria bacterium]|tara:strand:- start:215 stop:664 length:450 start_codon:yes stop_codon:yes gene_type:complete